MTSKSLSFSLYSRDAANLSVVSVLMLLSYLIYYLLLLLSCLIYYEFNR